METGRNDGVGKFTAMMFNSSFGVAGVTVLRGGSGKRLFMSVPECHSGRHSRDGNIVCGSIYGPVATRFQRRLCAGVLSTCTEVGRPRGRRARGRSEARRVPRFSMAIAPCRERNDGVGKLTHVCFRGDFVMGGVGVIRNGRGVFMSVPSCGAGRISRRNGPVCRSIYCPIAGSFERGLCGRVVSRCRGTGSGDGRGTERDTRGRRNGPSGRGSGRTAPFQWSMVEMRKQPELPRLRGKKGEVSVRTKGALAGRRIVERLLRLLGGGTVGRRTGSMFRVYDCISMLRGGVSSVARRLAGVRGRVGRVRRSALIGGTGGTLSRTRRQLGTEYRRVGSRMLRIGTRIGSATGDVISRTGTGKETTLCEISRFLKVGGELLSVQRGMENTVGAASGSVTGATLLTGKFDRTKRATTGTFHAFTSGPGISCSRGRRGRPVAGTMLTPVGTIEGLFMSVRLRLSTSVSGLSGLTVGIRLSGRGRVRGTGTRRRARPRETKTREIRTRVMCLPVITRPRRCRCGTSTFRTENISRIGRRTTRGRMPGMERSGTE